MPRTKQEGQKRKKRVYVAKEAPCPIPIASTSGEAAAPETCFYYSGYIERSTVVIKHSGDMDFLYKMGFFGKGSMSRSQPNFCERKHKVNIQLPTTTTRLEDKDQHFKTVQAAVMTKRNYLVHKKFKALAEGKTEIYNEIIGHEEHQQGFADSSEGEMEDSDFEDTESDLGRAEAFRLLSSENQVLHSDGTQPATTPAIPNLPVNLSKYIRSYLVAMLAEVSLLSNEQITTFVHVPQTLEQLEDKFRSMRAAELNMLRQAYAAQFPGRNFKKGEVIMLDEEEVCPKNKNDELGNEADDAVLIIDSDEEDDSIEKTSFKEGPKEPKDTWDDYDDGDSEFWGTGDKKDTESSSKNVESGIGTSDRSNNDPSDTDFLDGGKNSSGFQNGCKSDARKEDIKVDSFENSRPNKREKPQVGEEKEVSNPEKLEENLDTTSKTSSNDLAPKSSESSTLLGGHKDVENSDVIGAKLCGSDVSNFSMDGDPRQVDTAKDPKQAVSDGRDDKESGKDDRKTEKRTDLPVGAKNKEKKLDVKLNGSNSSENSAIDKTEDSVSSEQRISGTPKASSDGQNLIKATCNSLNEKLAKNDDDSKDDKARDIIIHEADAKQDLKETYNSLSCDALKRQIVKDISQSADSDGLCGNLPSVFDSTVSHINVQIDCDKEFSKSDSQKYSNKTPVVERKDGDPEARETFFFEACSPDGEEGASLQLTKPAVDDDEPDSGQSNDSDDVICIESKSAEPKQLRNFLSQPSSKSKSSTAVVTKSIVFMSNITNLPTYVSASVGFQSWKNVLHFNYTGDPSHLPTAMTVLPPQENENSLDGRNHQKPGMVYERVYPPIRSLVPNPGSQGAIIKQRLKGLPYLNAAYLKVGAHEVDSGLDLSVNSPRDPASLNLGKQKNISASNLAAMKSTQSHSRSSRKISPSSSISKISSSVPNFLTPRPQEVQTTFVSHPDTLALISPDTLSHLQTYLQAYQSGPSSNLFNVSESPCSSQGRESCNTANQTVPSFQLEALWAIVSKLDKLYKSTASKPNTHSIADESSKMGDLETLLLEFHMALLGHLTFAEISTATEVKLLQLLLSKEETITDLLPEKVQKIAKQLSAFQKWLLDKRLMHVKERQKSLSNVSKNSEEMFVVDLTENSKTKNEDSFVNEKVLKQDENENVGDQGDEKKLKRKLDKSESCEEGIRKKVRTVKSDKDEMSEIGSDGNRADSRDLKAKDKIVTGNKLQSTKEEKLKENKPGVSEDVDFVEMEEDHLHSAAKKAKTENYSDLCNIKEPKNGSENRESANVSEIAKNSLALENSQVSIVGSSVSFNSEMCNNLSPLTSCFESKESDETGQENIDSSYEKDSQQNSHTSEKIDSFINNETREVTSSDNKKSSKTDTVSSTDHKMEVDLSSSSESNLLVSFQQSQDIHQQAGSSKDFQICIDSSSEEEGSISRKPHQTDSSVNSAFHPYSITDDLQGDVFVVANTSDEDDCVDEDERGLFMKRKEKWRPCVKDDPYPSQEKLHLLLEEAFFLSFGLGCLRIMDPEMKLLDLTQTWQQFQVLKDHFVPQYVAYHYFRSKGWVPKSGLKFGCDWILYREGPPFYHGSYSVVVMTVSENWLLPCGRDEGFQFDHRQLNWISLAGLNRITEHVAKELMLCYVIWPKHLSKEGALSPACISKFKVKEVVLSRWVSSQERENKTDEAAMP